MDSEGSKNTRREIFGPVMMHSALDPVSRAGLMGFHHDAQYSSQNYFMYRQDCVI